MELVEIKDIANEEEDFTLQKRETFLTEQNISFLCRMFETEEDYRYYMKTLWLLRGLAGKQCARDTPNGQIYDHNDSFFPIWKTANKLIGSLLQDRTFFDAYGDMTIR